MGPEDAICLLSLKPVIERVTENVGRGLLDAK
jgi:hypothetical protein